MKAIRSTHFVSTRLAPVALLLSSFALIGLAIAVMTTAAPAQMPGGANNPAVQAAMSACKEDRAMFCASVAPGGGRIARCLMDHADALTPQCRTALNEARTAMGASAAAPR